MYMEIKVQAIVSEGGNFKRKVIGTNTFNIKKMFV